MVTVSVWQSHMDEGLIAGIWASSSGYELWQGRELGLLWGPHNLHKRNGGQVLRCVI